MESNIDQIKNHLLKRNPERGIWWPIQKLIKKNVWSKEIWNFDGNEWRMAISPDMKVTDYGTQLSFFKPQLEAKGKIYRVLSRDQLINLNNEILHLPPIPTNKTRMERNFLNGVDALSKYCLGGKDLLTERGRIDFFSKLDSLLLDPRGGIFEYCGENYTAYEIGLSRLLYENFDVLCDGLRSEIKKIPKDYMGISYVFNAYLGSRNKHYLDYLITGDIKMPPEILNLATNVRFFTTKSHIENTINYIISPSVFRGYDMYKRGINGHTPAQRLNQYVVIEYKYNREDIRSGKIEIADFSKYYQLLSSFLMFDEPTQKNKKILFPNGKGKEEKQKYLLNALKVWSNIFSEVRVYSNGIKPTAILKIDAIWGDNCSEHDNFNPCPICTQFYVSERFDCSKPGVLGALAAYGIMGLCQSQK